MERLGTVTSPLDQSPSVEREAHGWKPPRSSAVCRGFRWRWRNTLGPGALCTVATASGYSFSTCVSVLGLAEHWLLTRW